MCCCVALCNSSDLGTIVSSLFSLTFIYLCLNIFFIDQTSQTSYYAKAEGTYFVKNYILIY